MFSALTSVNTSIFGKKSEKENSDIQNMSADNITLAEFREKLGKYPDVIKGLTKPVKDDQLTLEQLDQFRYIDAPSQFSKKAGGKILSLSDLQKLVDWKIHHGKFRGTLLKLVSSNKEETITSVLTEAFEGYAKDSSNIGTTINKIAELKGIGPATASLVLSIHDPEHVIFFSDEAYTWLCHKGGKVSLKYNVKEYEELDAKSKALASKLNVTPLDIEKVAYVIIKESEPAKEPVEKYIPTGKPRGRPKIPDELKKATKVPSGLGRGRPRKEKVAISSATKVPAKRGRPPGAKKEVAKEEKEKSETEPAKTPVQSAKRKATDAPSARSSNKKAKA